MVVRAATDQPRRDWKLRLKTTTVCRILIFWLSWKFSNHFLFPYFFNLSVNPTFSIFALTLSAFIFTRFFPFFFLLLFVVVVVVISLHTCFCTGCIQETGEGNSPFCHSCTLLLWFDIGYIRSKRGAVQPWDICIYFFATIIIVSPIKNLLATHNLINYSS